MGELLQQCISCACSVALSEEAPAHCIILDSLVPRPHPQERGTTGGHDQDSAWHELRKTPIKPHRVSSAHVQRMKLVDPYTPYVPPYICDFVSLLATIYYVLSKTIDNQNSTNTS